MRKIFQTISPWYRFISNVPKLCPIPSSSSHSNVLGPLVISTRLKSKGHAQHKHQFSKAQISKGLLEYIKEQEMNKQYEETLLRFQNALQQRLALRMTPQLFADLQIPGHHTKLGEVANLILQNSASPNTDQTLLIDLAGRPDLVSPVRKAVTQFLNSSEGGSGNTLLQVAGPTAFTIRLRSVITRETRDSLIQLGNKMFNQTKREMDKIYQCHDKLLIGSKPASSFSQEDVFIAREYLRATVKNQHALAAEVWKKKQSELQGI